MATPWLQSIRGRILTDGAVGDSVRNGPPEKEGRCQMLHVGNIYLHFPLNVAIFHQM